MRVTKWGTVWPSGLPQRLSKPWSSRMAIRSSFELRENGSLRYVVIAGEKTQ